MARDVVSLRGLQVACVVGMRAEERGEEQPLEVDLDLGLDAARAAFSGRIAATCDYDRVAEEAALLLRFRRYRLLEMAAEELSAMLLGVHPVLQSVRARLSKPRALADRARSAAVEVSRTPGDFPRHREPTEFGEVEILYESRRAGLYLLHLEVGRSIPAHYHRRMRELEWRVSGSIARDGRLLTGLDPIEWSQGQVHTYVNVGTGRATLFCCDDPPFSRDDEVLVDGKGEGA